MTITDGSFVDLPTSRGPMRVHLFIPQGGGRYPGVIFYSEIFQVTGPIRRMAAALSGQGFLVAVPEVYHEFEPAGTVLASGGSDGQVCLFQPRRRVGRRGRSEDNDQPLDGLIDAEDSVFLAGEITALAWTSRGGLLAAADRRGTVAVLRIG